MAINKKYLDDIKKELESALEPLIANAQIYFKNNDTGYFEWLSKAGTLKIRSPMIPFEELTPEKMGRPLVQVFKESIPKK